LLALKSGTSTGKLRNKKAPLVRAGLRWIFVLLGRLEAYPTILLME
jgi:hypothetical protein